jgi:hypothetical protein
MTPFEYRVVQVSQKEILGLKGKKFDAEAEFNRLGAEGWECVSCESITLGTLFSFTAVLVYTFKRPKPAQADPAP